MRTLFLQAPSFDGFDGGAGSRYQAKREIKSFWYPTWLAQPAALVENSKLIDAPPHKTSLGEVVAQAKDFDLVVAHTSVPSFKSDVKVIEALKEANPNLKAGLIGAKVAVNAEGSLKDGPAIDFVARNEFDFTIKEVADGNDWSAIKGLSFRNNQGVIVHNEDRAILHDMDSLPWVTPVYKRDLVMENYFIGYLKHPYISIYTGRGCKSRCTFCLWTQSVVGQNDRTRSVGHVVIVPAHGLRPQAEGAARFAAAARVDRDVGMLQIADEVVLHHQVALVDRRDPGKAVHVVQDRAILVVHDDALIVAERQPLDRGLVVAVGDLLDGEVELVARDEIDRGAVLQRAFRVDRDLGADQAGLEVRIRLFQRLDHLHVRFERRHGGVRDDEVEILRLRHDLTQRCLVRRRVDQLGVLDQGGGLRQPGRIPEALDLALGLVARARAAVEAVERRCLQEKRAHGSSNTLPV